MRIRDVMRPDIEAVMPGDRLRTAARLMADLDVEALPVSENNSLIGTITSCDIAKRVVAEGCDPSEATVGQVMTGDTVYCFEDEPVGNVLRKMSGWWVRRLPVVNREKRLVGMVSLADLTALKTAPQPAACKVHPAA